MSNEQTVRAAIKLLGGASAVARACGLKTAWGAAKWATDGLPADRVLWLAEQTAWRFTPHDLAPELYPHPDDGLPDRFRGGRLREFDAGTTLGQSA
jgi:hypothetical protein